MFLFGTYIFFFHTEILLMLLEEACSKGGVFSGDSWDTDLSRIRYHLFYLLCIIFVPKENLYWSSLFIF